MTLYTVVNPSTLIAGQPEDVSQVLANFQAIANILNGNVDNSNLNPAANIAPSKILLGANGQILQSVGPSVAWGMKITTSPISGGPPGSPNDGDIWIATGVDGAGARWSFQYNAGSASAYKWEFIGGPPITADNAAQVSGITSTVDIPLDPNLTAPRAGDYTYSFGVRVTPTATSIAVYVVPKFGATAIDSTNQALFYAPPTVGGSSVTLGKQRRANGVAASALVQLYAHVSGGSADILERTLSLTPIRIS